MHGLVHKITPNWRQRTDKAVRLGLVVSLLLSWVAGLMPAPLNNLLPGLTTPAYAATTNPAAERTTLDTIRSGLMSSDKAHTALANPNAMLLAPTSISGKVYRDFNSDGQVTANGVITDTGVSGVTVTIYDQTGAVAGSAVTDSNGNYTITPTGTAPYRVEFTTLPAGYYPTTRSSTNGTTVQFVTTTGVVTNVNLAINDPCDYCQSSPKLITSRMEAGTGSGNTNAAVISLPFSAQGTTVQHTTGATFASVGAVWGIAIQRSTQRAYAGAFLKRQAGFGLRGADGVYVINYSGSTPALAGGFDLEGVTPSNGGTIALGSVTRTTVSGNGTNANDLSSNAANPSRDADAFGKVGKISYGDVDFADDDQTLWLVNLNQRTLIAVDTTKLTIATANPNLASSAAVKHYAIDAASTGGAPVITNAPTCSPTATATLRPWGLAFRNGKGYLGVVCDAAGASSYQGPTELKAYVLSFDTANPTNFTTEVTVALNYSREMPWGPQTSTGFTALQGPRWQRWMDSWTSGELQTGSFTFVAAPQPILSDITFLDDGSLALGFIDRFTHQQGWANYPPNSSSATYSAVTAGDILRAYWNGTTYTFEGGDNDAGPVFNAQNESSSLLPTGAFLTNDGPSGQGEFFWGDFYYGHDALHGETSVGGLAVLPGSNRVANTVFDPLDFMSHGIRWFNTTTGSAVRAYQVIANTGLREFGKGAGMGDLELLCDPAPLEIGNRLWQDDDFDGLQDPGEAGLSGVTLQLWADTTGDGVVDAKVAQTTTDANGNYLFSRSGTNSYGQSENWSFTSATTLAANTAYEIRIDTTQAGLSSFTLTKANQAQPAASNAAVTDNNPFTDLADSDGVQVGNTARITYTTAGAGANNHSLDVGFYLPAAFGDRVWIESDSDGLASTGTILPLSGLVITATNGVKVYTATTTAAGYYSFTVPGGVYTITYGSLPAGYGTLLASATPGGSTANGNAGTYRASGNPDQSHANGTTVTVAAGQANWQVDFAFYIQVVHLGNRLWIEDDNDGDATTGNVTPVGAGHVVTATASDESTTYTALTDLNGYYTITVPANDEYQVTTDLPAGGLVDTPVLAIDGTNLAADNRNHDRIGTIVVMTTTDNLSIDFGFFLPQGALTLVKQTSAAGVSAADADTPPGPSIDVGAVVTWTYAVTNTGNVTLTNLMVADDQEGSATCPFTALAPGATMTCVLTGTATVGQYANTAVVTGTPTLGSSLPVTASNPSHYFGVAATIGDRVWYDDNYNGLQDGSETGVANVSVELLDRNDAVIDTATTNATGYYSFTNLAPGLYSLHFVTTTLPSGYIITQRDLGTDNAADSDADPTTGRTVNTLLTGGESDLDWDLGLWWPQPALAVVKSTNGADADLATGPIIAVGAPVTWTYEISNTGNVTLTNIVVTDDQEGTITCPQSDLAPGAGMTCLLPGTATAGQYMNTALVSGTPTVGTTTPVTASNPSHYFGGNPSLVLRKYTNGYDADDAPGPFLTPGAVVTWTYVLTNTGNQPLANLLVVDSSEGAIPCPGDALAVGATMTCLYTGTVQAGQYTNTAVVSGTTTNDIVLTFTNPSHYYGVAASLAVKKYTNGVAADTIPGPIINEGAPVTWTYVVTNTGDVALTALTLVDDQEGAITCSATTLAVGATMTCTASGLATAGQYTNTVVVTGTPSISTNPTPDLPGYPPSPTPSTPVTTTDLSHYFGQAPVLLGNRLWIEDDNDGAAATGTVTPVGAGQVVTATANDGVTRYTGTTDANGLYTITVPANATYTVTTDLPTGGVVDTPVLVSDGSSPAANNDRNHDRLGTTVVLTTVDNLSIDFGFVQLGSIGDTIWYDADNSGGDQGSQGSEPGLAGVAVQLSNATGVISTTTTDSSGNYLFANLPLGTYTVTVNPATLPLTVTATPTYDPDGGNDAVSVVTLALATPDKLDQDFSYPPVRYDYGDLPDGKATTSPNYATLRSSNGPRHTIIDGLSIGTVIDADPDGQPALAADGDDAVGADEEGVQLPSFVAGQTATVTVTVVNTTGAAAILYGFIDFDGNGSFSATETVTQTVPSQSGNQTVLLAFAVPAAADAAQQLGARFRLSTDAGLSADGAASNGEVEDYLIAVQRYDLALIKTVAAVSDTPLIPGTSVVTFTITVTNQGNMTATDVVVIDTVPATLTYAPVDNPGWTATTPAVTTLAGPLAPHTAAAVNLVLRVPLTATGATITNTAEISSALTATGAPFVDVDSTADSDPANDGPVTDNEVNNANNDEDDHDLSVISVGEHVAIGNLIWHDLNMDGNYDSGLDLPIQGVTVTLYLSASRGVAVPVASTVSDSAGHYLFDNLEPGTYYVQIDPANFRGRFGSGGVLVNYLSTIGGATSDETTDQNGDENGIDNFDPATNGIRSRVYTLTAHNQPTGDDDTGYTGVLDDDNVNLTADFGFLLFGHIGDTIWYDADRSGGDQSSQGSEPGLAGVEVQLRNASGVISTTTTNSNGVYTFDNLLLGVYTVTVNSATLPYTVTTTPTFTGDGGTDSQSAVTLTPAAPTNLAQDFSYPPVLGSIGDTLWYDTDRSGGDQSSQGGEPGLAGVEVELTDSLGNLVTTTTTDSQGHYLFSNLPLGTYTITVNPATLPNTVVITPTYDADGNSDNHSVVTLTPTTPDNLDQDFSYPPVLGSIGDTIWYDTDRSGGDQSGQGSELGLAGVEVQLTDSLGNLVTTTTTDSQGHYLFANLPLGTYTVTVNTATLPNTVVITPTYDADGNSDNHSVVTLTPSAADNLNQDFSYEPVAVILGSIGDTIWYDADSSGGDQSSQGSELGLAGVEVQLSTGRGVISTTTTDGKGNYLFANLPLGTYTVTVNPATLPNTVVITPTYDADGNSDNHSVVTLTPTTPDNLNQDFSYPPVLGSIGDTIWYDADRSGGDQSSQGGEPGLAGVEVQLTDSLGNLVTITTTDSQGHYLFSNLPLGTYTVTVNPATLPNTMVITPTYDADGNSDNHSVVTLTPAAADNLNQDFSYEPVAVILGSIGDTIWYDADSSGGDQSSQGSELGLAGVEVQLSTGRGVISTTTTDGKGNYLFANLPLGTYTVTVNTATLPNTVVITPTYDADGNSDNHSVVTLTPAVPDNLKQDFSYPPVLGSIGDTIWYDTDRSGGDQSTQGGEPGLAGVEVQLTDSLANLVTTTTTDSQGHYLFSNLPLGTYTVTINPATLPNTVVITPTYDADGNSDNHSVVTLTPAAPNNAAQDFSYEPVVVILGSIGDTIWYDADSSGGDQSSQGAELGLAGVEVQLSTGRGVISTTTTDGKGHYLFANLSLGTYTVTVNPATLPNTVVITPTYDADGNLGNHSVVTLTPTTPDNLNQDFSYPPVLGSIGDTIWYDTDRSGGDQNTQGGEPGLAGVEVSLTDSLGNLVTTTTTDSQGHYLFSNLPLGTYTVTVNTATLPATVVITPTHDADGNSDNHSVVTLTLAAPNNAAQDFSYEPVAVILGSIGDTIWYDADNSGGDQNTQGSELGLAGVEVQLSTGRGVISTTTTDGKGNYLFANLPLGTYTVTVNPATLPNTVVITPTYDADGNSDSHSVVTLTPTTPDNLNQDFSYPPVLGSIGDTLWYDTDRSGGDQSTQGGEPGISGIEVQLTDSLGNLVTTTTTDSQGHYLFSNLPLGTYTVTVNPATLPNTVVITPTYDADGNSDNHSVVTLTLAAPNNATQDFSYPPVILPSTATPTDTPTATPTDTPTATPTSTPTATNTALNTATPTDTPTDTPTATNTATNTPTVMPTNTSTVIPTNTPTATDTPTAVLTNTPTATPTSTPTATDTPTAVPTNTSTNTPTAVPTSTATVMPTATPTATPTTMPVIYRDYGDLRDTNIGHDFPTAGNDGGEGVAASHDIVNTLYLGNCVDGEPDGAPDERAGVASSGGDDHTAGQPGGTVGSCVGNDDEDGVTLVTPLIAGANACVMATVFNQTGGKAVLQGWLDFNGDGHYDTEEMLNTGDFTGGGAVIPNGGVTNQRYCFTTPATATFDGGETYLRWRLSSAGGLAAAGPAPDGEVEDYWQPLVCLGNWVWIDWDEDGIQDTTDPVEVGVPGMTVTLIWYGPNQTYEAGLGDDLRFTTTTDALGTYHFCGLLPSSAGQSSIYEIQLIDPFAPIATQPLAGADGTFDSNIINGGVFTTIMHTDPIVIPVPLVDATMPFTLPVAEGAPQDQGNQPHHYPDSSVDETIDLGLDPHDMGDLPDANGGVGNFPTNLTNGGEGTPALHTIQSDLYLGDCVDAEIDGQPHSRAGTDNLGGDDATAGFVVRGACGQGTPSSDDEDGVALVTPLVPAGPACVAVTAHVPVGEQGVFEGWIDFNGDGDFGTAGGAVDANEWLSTRDFADGKVVLNASVNRQLYCFDVPPGATTLQGDVYMRFRLSDDGLTPDNTSPLSYSGPADTGEVEDYVMKPPPYCVGNYLWLDQGATLHSQDGGDAPASGVTVNLIWGGPDELISTTADNFFYPTTTDATGHYHFCGLTPDADGDGSIDQYQVVVPTAPPGTLSVRPDQGGNDSLDSDGLADINNAAASMPFTISDDTTNRDQASNDTSNLEGGVPDLRDDLTIDFGFIQPGAIGNLVWNDTNQNGIQDPGEAGLSNILVSLFDAVTNNLVAVATTDSSGIFQFTDLLPGSYYMQFTLPAGYGFTIPGSTPGSDLDSNTDPTTGQTPVITLLPGQISTIWDSGIYQLPTSLQQGQEPGQGRLFLPIVARRYWKVDSNGKLVPITIYKSLCGPHACIAP